MRKQTVLVVGVFVILASAGHAAFAQSTEFTYQGRLLSEGAPASGPHDFVFSLWDAHMGGTQVGPTMTLTAVNVNSGVFSVRLNFGDEFPGANRFLDIQVRQSGEPLFTPLAPRQAITSAPYAIKSLNANFAAEAENATNATTLGGATANEFVATTDPRLSDARNPLPNSPSYIQTNPGSRQPGNFGISGDGRMSTLYADNFVVTNVVSVGHSGTATFPAIRFAADLGNGIFRSAGQTLNFSTSGVSRLQISPNGNVGIGTLSPAFKLDVAGPVRVSSLVAGSVQFEETQTRVIALPGGACRPDENTSASFRHSSFACDLSSGDGGTPAFYWPLTLPNGVALVGMRIVDFIQAGTSVTCTLWRSKTGSSSSTDAIATLSDSTVGSKETSEIPLKHTVDNDDYFYVVTCRQSGTGNSEVNGIRIRYTTLSLD